jgi:hypothetical protein
MNASAAQAEYIQRAAEGIGFTLVVPLGRVIFDHHDGVHSKGFPSITWASQAQKPSSSMSQRAR